MSLLQVFAIKRMSIASGRSTWLRFARRGLAAFALLLVGCQFSLNPYSLKTDKFALDVPGSPISFNEITFDTRLNQLVVPAAETGALVLVDPENTSQSVIKGFSGPGSAEGQSVGATSAASGGGYLFALDRAAKLIKTIDLNENKVVSVTPVDGVPDVIRYVFAKRELWVTVKEKQEIQVFAISEANPPLVTTDGVIRVPYGPESLLIEEERGIAYTNQPQSGTTAVIQILTRGIIATWGNGCSNARGLALDQQKGYLFIACEEGKLVMIDVHSGFQLASQNYGGQLNMVAYNPTLQHVYLPSGQSAILAVFKIEKVAPGTSAPGGASESADSAASTATSTGANTSFRLVRLGTADTAVGANCAAADNKNRIWVCDPKNGRLIVVADTFAADAREAGK